MERQQDITKTEAQKRAEKIERQNKGLHGGEGVLGLTGRWRGTYYERGIANPGTVVRNLRLAMAAGGR